MEQARLIELALAVGLGLLVGLQREWASKSAAGIRTFALITLLGALSGQLAAAWGGLVVAVLLLALAALAWQGARSSADPDLTTAVAALVMFCVGASLTQGYRTGAVVTTGAVALLLHWKRPLHQWVERLDVSERRAVMRLVLIGLVILPVLPDRTYGPLGVLNPFEIWSMVVLIVGISVSAYVAHRLAGPRVGVLLAGVLGGLISSTATTVTYARRTRESPDEAPAAAVVFAVSSTTVFARVLVELGVVAPDALIELGAPALTAMALLAGVATFTWYRARAAPSSAAPDHAPSTLAAALTFGLLYAAVLVGVAAARRYLGDEALFAMAALSGLTDMDAITLSSARLVRAGSLTTEIAWRLILIGAIANLAFKAVVALILGDRRLRGWALAVFGSAIACTSGVVLLWGDR